MNLTPDLLHYQRAARRGMDRKRIRLAGVMVLPIGLTTIDNPWALVSTFGRDLALSAYADELEWRHTALVAA